MPATALPPFPPEHEDRPQAPAGLVARGIVLRSASAADIPFLRMLYDETREDELACVPWPPAVRQSFLDSQFDLQHRHYVTYFGEADFMVVEDGSHTVGRLYLLRQPPAFHIIDIALLEFVRGSGIGTALIVCIQNHAAACGCGVILHVDRRNAAARRLYERLGFVAAETDDSHLPMNWSPASLS